MRGLKLKNARSISTSNNMALRVIYPKSPENSHVIQG